ncbi:phosphorylase [Labrys okinawensis]|uniref:phosphorylase family protein n=1 Tax=Labrys okinawensis TaxID=346911 RepID=UPI0039BC2328
MSAEARIIRAVARKTVCGAANASLLRQRLASALTSGRTVGLVSFGLAGGLAPDLAPGTVVLADWVAVPGRRWNTDSGWRQRLLEACDGAMLAGVAGSDAPVATRLARQQLHSTTGASIVDMESHIVADMAGTMDLPFVVIRAVADGAGSDLPPAALIPLHDDGRPDLPRILASLARSPGQLPDLLRLARASRQAFASLGGVCRDLGPGLACPYFL